MNTDQSLLRKTLADAADEVVLVDLLDRVVADIQRQQRRRRLWIGGAALATAAASLAGVIALAPSERTAEPAPRPGPISVVLDPEADDQVDNPSMAVMTDTGDVWVLDDSGRQHLVARTDIASVVGLEMSNDGRWLVIGGTTGGQPRVAIVDTREAQVADSAIRELSPSTVPDGRRLFPPAVNPDGSLVAIATCCGVGPEATVQLLPIDGRPPVVLSLKGEDWAPTGQWVDVDFSDDGERLLVYPGNVGIFDVAGLLAGDQAAGSTTSIPAPYTYIGGRAAAPDLSQILVSRPEGDEGWRRWAVFNTDTGQIEGGEIVNHEAVELVSRRPVIGVAAYDLFQWGELTMVIGAPAGQALAHGISVR